MIGYLRGNVLDSESDHLILDVNGVGYHVFCSGRTLGELPAGQEATLYIDTHVREDHIHLYGFASKAERAWFRLLTSVQGVGTKLGLVILGSFDIPALQHCLAAGDEVPLTRVSGIGPKMARRIVTELKDKTATLPTSDLAMPAHSGTLPAASGTKTNASAAGSASHDAISALVNLGYGRTEAWQAIQQVAQEDSTAESLIRDALKELVA